MRQELHDAKQTTRSQTASSHRQAKQQTNTLLPYHVNKVQKCRNATPPGPMGAASRDPSEK